MALPITMTLCFHTGKYTWRQSHSHSSYTLHDGSEATVAMPPKVYCLHPPEGRPLSLCLCVSSTPTEPFSPQTVSGIQEVGFVFCNGQRQRNPGYRNQHFNCWNEKEISSNIKWKLVRSEAHCSLVCVKSWPRPRCTSLSVKVQWPSIQPGVCPIEAP